MRETKLPSSRLSTWVRPCRLNRLPLRAHPPICWAVERERAQITERLIKRPQTDLGRPFERTFAVTQDDTDRRGTDVHTRARA